MINFKMPWVKRRPPANKAEQPPEKIQLTSVITSCISGAGNSSIFMAVREGGAVSRSLDSSIGADFLVKEIRNIKLTIFEASGKERFRSINRMYYKTADLIYFVLDSTMLGEESQMQEDINKLLEDIKAHSDLNKEQRIFLIFSKADGIKASSLFHAKAKVIVKHFQLPGFECSAQTYRGIENMLDITTRTFLAASHKDYLDYNDLKGKIHKHPLPSKSLQSPDDLPLSRATSSGAMLIDVGDKQVVTNTNSAKNSAPSAAQHTKSPRTGGLSEQAVSILNTSLPDITGLIEYKRLNDSQQHLIAQIYANEYKRAYYNIVRVCLKNASIAYGAISNSIGPATLRADYTLDTVFSGLGVMMQGVDLATSGIPGLASVVKGAGQFGRLILDRTKANRVQHFTTVMAMADSFDELTLQVALLLTLAHENQIKELGRTSKSPSSWRQYFKRKTRHLVMRELFNDPVGRQAYNHVEKLVNTVMKARQYQYEREELCWSLAGFVTRVDHLKPKIGNASKISKPLSLSVAPSSSTTQNNGEITEPNDALKKINKVFEEQARMKHQLSRMEKQVAASSSQSFDAAHEVALGDQAQLKAQSLSQNNAGMFAIPAHQMIEMMRKQIDTLQKSMEILVGLLSPEQQREFASQLKSAPADPDVLRDLEDNYRL